MHAGFVAWTERSDADSSLVNWGQLYRCSIRWTLKLTIFEEQPINLEGRQLWTVIEEGAAISSLPGEWTFVYVTAVARHTEIHNSNWIPVILFIHCHASPAIKLLVRASLLIYPICILDYFHVYWLVKLLVLQVSSTVYVLPKLAIRILHIDYSSSHYIPHSITFWRLHWWQSRRCSYHLDFNLR